MKKVAKILEIVFHVLGFPLLLALIAVASIATIKGGLGYGLPVFVGLILTAVLCIVYYVAYIILTVGEKKRREKIRTRIKSAERNGSYRPSTSDPGIRTGIILAIISVCCLSGLWLAVDTLLPKPIASATSNTVYWEDLTDNWQARGEVHEDLLDTFIRRSFYAGNLTSKTLNEYLKEGITNKEVKKLIDDEFASIDKNGYGTYIGPAISLAQDERMTIPALVHLLLDEREPIKDANGNRLDEKIPLITFNIVYEAPFAMDIDTTQNYQYMRHNNQYYLYNEDFEEAFKPMDSLVVFESNKGYAKVQFLNGASKNKSFIYTIDTVDGFEINCTVITTDRIVETSSVKQKGNVYVVTSNDGTETVEDTYATLAELIESEPLYSFMEDLNLQSLSAVDFLENKGVKPDAWIGYNYVVLEKSTYLAYADWNVLDMLGEPMGFALPLSSITDLSIEFGPIKIEGAQLFTDYAQTIDDVLATASELTGKKELLGSTLTVSLDFETGELSLVPCNVERGTLDYMRTAWLYNNGLLYVLVSLFSTRKLYYIFAAVIALTSFLIGVMHSLAHKNDGEEKKSKKSKKGKKNAKDDLIDDNDLSVEGIDA